MSDDILDKFDRSKKKPEVIVEEPTDGPDIFAKFDRPPEIIKEEGKPTRVIMRAAPRSVAEAKGEFANRALASIPVLGPLAQRAVAGGMALVEGGINRLTGKPANIGESYDNSLQTQQNMAEDYGTNHPGLALGADIAGGSALLGPMSGTAIGSRMLGMTGTSLGTKVMQGAGGMGALETGNQLIRGNDPRDQGFTGPVPLAIVGGAAGPILGEAISAGGNKLMEMMPRSSGPLAGTNSITRNRLTEAMDSETPASIAAAREASGSSGMLMDTNQATRDIAGGLADIPGPHKGQIRETLRQRSAGQGDRIMASLDQNTVPQVNLANLTRSIDAAKKSGADPLYNQFRTMPVHPTPEIKALIPRLEKAGAFDLAEELSGISGKPIDRKFFTGGAQKEFPTAETWDYVKRGLDRRIGQALDKTKPDKDLARELLNLKSEMLAEIDKTPAGKVWKQARETFAEHSELTHQIEEGQKTFSRATRKDELAHEIINLSGPERAARVQGARDAIQQIIENSVRGDTTARNTLLTRANRDKLELLFGDKKAGRLIADLEAELNVSAHTNEIAHGSPTEAKGGRRAALLPPRSEPGYFRSIVATQPATFIPEWMTPHAMMEGAAAARYAASHQQLADLMRVRMAAPEFDHLVTEIMNEGGRRATRADQFDRLGGAASLALQTSGPALRNRLLDGPDTRKRTE